MVSVILKSSDLERTIRWYLAAGFELTGRDGGDAGEWCELTLHGVSIQFLAGVTPWPAGPAMTGCVYVPVEDARQALAALQDPVHSQWGLEDRPWGTREVVLQDPDGSYVALTER